MLRRQSGMTLAEILVSVGMVALLVFATMTVTSTAMQGTKGNMDKQFATQKAISMVEELKALVQVNTGGTVLVLDSYDDGTAFRDRLTTNGNLTDPPDAPISGNIAQGTGWLYSRQISVKPLTDPNDPTILVSAADVRLVRVRVYKNIPGGRQLIAEVASVIRTLAVSFPPSQQYDVYCIAVENIPGWWVNLASLRPFVENAISDLKARNPGLEFTEHWITKLSYGRDTQYAPLINSTNDSRAAIGSVYFYPGRMPTSYTAIDSGNMGPAAPLTPYTSGQTLTSPQAYYYDPAVVDARYWNDAATPAVVNDLLSYTAAAATTPPSQPNPYPYALADMFNHSMRWPQEWSYYQQRKNAVNTDGTPTYPNEEPTLRLLLDDMVLHPDQYVNALVINLHGELLPFPPVRNYSDAAKIPEIYKTNGVRVVTHPEQLTYANSSGINLRVYSYVTDPTLTVNTSAGTATIPRTDPVTTTTTNLASQKEWLQEPITVILKGINWDPAGGLGHIYAITGGVDLDPRTVDATVPAGLSSPNTCAPVFPLTTCTPAAPFSQRDPYRTIDLVAAGVTATNPATPHMYYTRTTSGSDTVIKLWNSPLVSPCVPDPTNCAVRQQPSAQQPAGQLGSGGIENSSSTATKRLYGLEYIPAPLERFDSSTAVTPFTTDLTTLGDSEKNTARWVIQIPASALSTNNNLWSFETRIGDYDPTTDTFSAVSTVDAKFKEPPNDSWTYVWRGADTWLYGDTSTTPVTNPALPMTERYQILGDPRHCPYADLKKPHTTNGGAWNAANVNVNLGMGYNRFFDDFENDPAAGGEGDFANGGCTSPTNAAVACWQGWQYVAGGVTYGIKNDNSYLNAGFNDDSNGGAGMNEYDVPRIFQIFRYGLLNTNAVYTSMTGYPYYYLGIGNEMGSDAAQDWPDSLPVNPRPFTGVNTANYFEQSILPSSAAQANGVKYIKEGNNSWWGLNWIGELYPDKMYDLGASPPVPDWKHKGNLPTPNPLASPAENGSSASRYLRVQRDLTPTNTAGDRTHTPGTTLFLAARRTSRSGMPTFYWQNAPGGAGINITGGTNGTATTFGTEIATSFNFAFDTVMPAIRAFDITNTYPTGLDALGQSVYSPLMTLGAPPLRVFYSSDVAADSYASALMVMRQGATNSAAFVVQNGLSPTGTTGTDVVARWAFCTLIQGFLEAGLYNSGNAPAITELPRVRVTAPNSQTDLFNPSTVAVTWATDWKRWDGRNYTNSYTSTFTEPSPIQYLLMYSSDNGITWKYVQDNAAATTNTRLPSTDTHWITTSNGATSTGGAYSWSVPSSSFPTGSYVLRIEAYRQTYQLHHSFHMYQLFIKR